jgi:probable rRNA maturation factor
LSTWLPNAAPASARGGVTIALISDAAMRRLNREYRGKDYATDVLSWKAGPSAAVPGPRGPGLQTSGEIGDIAIALGVARRQACEQGHSVSMELRVLALHGLLHLLGYDHDTDRGQMRRLEDRLRRRAGLGAGLIGRQRARAGRR